MNARPEDGVGAADSVTQPITRSSVAVVVPCFNEEATIAAVIGDFRAALPEAVIVVGDNASTDRTAEIARAHGARVVAEHRQGKGFMVSRLFAEVDADCYVMVDGDATYDASSAPEMVRMVLDDGVDMVCGVRLLDSSASDDREYRRGHQIGNRAFSSAFSRLFGMPMADVFSGYRAMSRGFVKSFLGAPRGFEVEVELNAHCYVVVGGYRELGTVYRARPEESASKLRTYRDGFAIGRALLRLFRELRPFAALAMLAVPCLALAIALGLYAVIPYFQTGLVLRFPSLIASVAFALAAVIFLTVGFVLSRVAVNRRELRRSAYLREVAPLVQLRASVD